MVSKFSLFMATAQYNFLRFIPGKKQQFFEYLEELSENVQTDFFCQDILEVWLENFGIGGLVLGSAAAVFYRVYSYDSSRYYYLAHR